MMKRILVVDDEASIRESLPPILESTGVSVLSASTLDEAQDLLNSHRFDVVITDLRLSGSFGEEGLELISRVKRSAPATHVVLLTAFGNPEVELEARLRGATECWKKTIQIPDILSRLKNLGIPL
jgi:DNA-binding NtrC family response regulator